MAICDFADSVGKIEFVSDAEIPVAPDDFADAVGNSQSHCEYPFSGSFHQEHLVGCLPQLRLPFVLGIIIVRRIVLLRLPRHIQILSHFPLVEDKLYFCDE